MLPTRELIGLGEIQAVLGPGTRFDGKLTFEGCVRIDGHLEGEVFGDGVLIVGEGAKVHATVDVGTLIVRGGVVRGRCSAKQLIEIHAEAAVHGDIQAPEIDIAKGCIFEGRCTVLSVVEERNDPDDA
jgi:cytoskeletal protein CcmA (bactofilin family)